MQAQQKKPTEMKLNTSTAVSNDFNSNSIQYLSKSKIHLHPKILTFLIFIYPLTVAFVTLILYLMQGRWSGYIPTISETGTEYPNNNFFGILMSTGSFTTGFALFLHAVYIHQFTGCSQKVAISLYIFSFFSCVGIAGLGFFSINEDHKHHFMFAFGGFVSILLYELIALCSNKSVPTKMKQTRAILLLLAGIGFFIFGGLDWYLSNRRNATICALGEYLLLYCMMFIIYTYHYEIDLVNINIVLISSK